MKKVASGLNLLSVNPECKVHMRCTFAAFLVDDSRIALEVGDAAHLREGGARRTTSNQVWLVGVHKVLKVLLVS